MPRFVLLRHECPPQFEKPSHWDFMLEWHGVLRTWDLRELPTTWAGVLGETAKNSTVQAIPLPDHRLAYLDFEGPLTEDRGHVRRCDQGTYELLQDSEELLTIKLNGALLRGAIRLVRKAEGWLLDPSE